MSRQWNNSTFQEVGKNWSREEPTLTPGALQELAAQLNEGGSDPNVVLIDEWQLHCGALCNYLRAAGIDVTPLLQSLVDQLPPVERMPDMRSPKPRKRKSSE